MSVYPHAIIVIVVKHEYINSYKFGTCLGYKEKLNEKYKHLIFLALIKTFSVHTLEELKRHNHSHYTT